MKRIVSLVLAISMILSLFVSAFAAGYSDLTGDAHVYAGAVEALSELEVIEGFTDGTFGPEKLLTRAQLAKMMVVCGGLGTEVEGLKDRTVFSDVPSTHWAAGYINAASQSKLIMGYPNGEFKPEKNVSYAEAFTMALRALGYGAVVEAEGTWPTAYMAKARELKLTDDLQGKYSADDAAIRGNTAVLLWNMLRTPMWKITSESEGNGMTKSNAEGDYMLNVKFPDYRYVEEAYIMEINVSDKDDVTVKLDVSKDDKVDLNGDTYTADVKNVDLLTLVEGKKVSALIGNYKKDNNIFLTLTPANTMVSGYGSDKEINSKTGVVTFKVDDTEYRMDDDGARLAATDYVLFEVDGKKVSTYDGEYVLAKLPTTGKYATSRSVINSDIDEDDLVLIDGEWTDRDSIDVGGVYTELNSTTAPNLVTTGHYFVAVNGPVEGEFDILSTDTVKWEGAKVDVEYLSLDEEELRLGATTLAAKEMKDEKVDNTISLADLRKKAKDNDYNGLEAAVFVNYLGNPVRIEFSDVDKNSSNNNFYAVVSNGAWKADGTSKGDSYLLGLVDSEGTVHDVDGDEDPIQTTNKATVDPALVNRTVYDSETATFAWVKFDDNNEELASRVVVLYDGMKSGDASGYTGKYSIMAAKPDTKIDEKKVTLADGNVHNMTSSTVVFEAVAHLDDDDDVDGFTVTVSNDYKEYDATLIKAGTLAAIDASGRIKFLFLASEAESDDVMFAIAEKGSSFAKDKLVTADEEYELAKGSTSFSVEDIVKFKIINGKAKVIGVFDPSKLDDDSLKVVASLNSDEKDEHEDQLYFTDGTYFNTDSDSSDYKDHKKYNVYKFTVENKNSKVEVSSIESLGKGYKSLDTTDYDRVLVLDSDKAIIIFTEFTEDDVLEGGKFVLAHSKPTVLPKTYTLTLSSGDVTMNSGDTITLTATVTESGDSTPIVIGTTTWTSSMATVATVTDGTVAALASGDTVITATWVSGDDSASATASVHVVDLSV